MYAEKAMPIINSKNNMRFVEALTSRLDDFEKGAKRSRIEKLLKKIKLL